MKDIDAQRILEAYEAVDPESGSRMSPDKHAKAVQWTKDIKAKLAQAQKIGDSKEANKLQRYLDMHGIDEADDQPYDPTKSPFYEPNDPDNDRNIAQDNRARNLQTLQPLDGLAVKAGADDIIDWLAKQIEAQGEGWVDWFEQTVMIEQ